MTELESYIQWRNSSTDPKHTHARTSKATVRIKRMNQQTNDLVIRPDSVFNFHYSSTDTAQHYRASLFFNYISTGYKCVCMTIAIAILHGYVHFVALTHTEFMCECCCSLCAAAGALCAKGGQNHSLCVLWIIWSKNNTDYSLCCHLLLLFDVIVVVVSVLIFFRRILRSHCDFEICVSVESYVIVLAVASFFASGGR